MDFLKFLVDSEKCGLPRLHKVCILRIAMVSPLLVIGEAFESNDEDGSNIFLFAIERKQFYQIIKLTI